LFYKSLYNPQPESEAEVSVELSMIFPYEIGEKGKGVYVIPLETMTVILFFRYLFGFDLAVPVLVAMGSFVSSLFSTAVRKKKSVRQKKK
jgi:hypothetical protein